MQDKESNGSKLVEIVARAIRDAEALDTYGADRWRDFVDGHDSGWTVEEHVPFALAALTAIKEAGMVIVPREPTEAAIDAGRANGPVVLVERSVGAPHARCLLPEEAERIYRAMIAERPDDRG